MIKNKAETTHSCIAGGEKGKAVCSAAGCGLRRAMVLVARHPWRPPLWEAAASLAPSLPARSALPALAPSRSPTLFVPRHFYYAPDYSVTASFFCSRHSTYFTADTFKTTYLFTALALFCDGRSRGSKGKLICSMRNALLWSRVWCVNNTDLFYRCFCSSRPRKRSHWQLNC